jgi:hypothetical protein
LADIPQRTGEARNPTSSVDLAPLLIEADESAHRTPTFGLVADVATTTGAVIRHQAKPVESARRTPKFGIVVDVTTTTGAKIRHHRNPADKRKRNAGKCFPLLISI